MMRKTVITFMLILAGCASSGETVPPNILMIIVDDLGRQDVGVYGGDFYETPNIDDIATAGLRFENAYAAHPRCLPSRLGIMSGQYPARFGIPGFQNRKLGKHALPLDVTTFAEVLRDAGYKTGYIGKWHLGKEGGGPEYQGFDVSIMAGKSGAPPSYFWPYEKPRKKSDSKSFVDYTGGQEGEYLTDRLTDEALGFIEQEKDGPFLLVLAHYAVHTPIEGPERLTRKYRRKLQHQSVTRDAQSDIVIDGTGEVKTQQNNPDYAAMVESVDHNIGRLEATLEALGLDENTVIIVTSDHGGLSSRGLGNRRELATANLPYRHGKGWLYDGGIRVPMILKWPAQIAAGSVSKLQTTGTDHFSSILDMVGLPLRPELHADSSSYFAAIDEPNAARPAMYWHSSLGRPAQTGDTRSSAVIDGEWKLIQWYSLQSEQVDRVELFNLRLDPGEVDDLSGRESEQLDRLTWMLEGWKASVNARLGQFKKGGV